MGIIYQSVSELDNQTPLRVLRGKVTSQNGDAFSGVSVAAKDAKVGTATDSKGEFVITVEDHVTTLIFTHIGFVTREVIISDQQSMSVVLQVDAKGLSDVVVVGYGQVKKNDVTGSVSTIPVKEMKKAGGYFA